MDKELTYEEHVNAKKNTLKNEYSDRIFSILRNNEFEKGDLCNEGFLTNSFFENSKINPVKKSILRDITKQFKNKLNKIGL